MSEELDTPRAYCQFCGEGRRESRTVSVNYCFTCQSNTTFLSSLESPKLTKVKALAELLVVGKTPKEAGNAVGYSTAQVNRLLKQSGPLRDYMAKLRKAAEDESILTLKEMARFLTKAIMTPIDEVDGKSPFCQEKKVVSRKAGKETIETTTFKMMGKGQACDLLAKIMGFVKQADGPTVNVSTVVTSKPEETIKRWREELETTLSLPPGTIEKK